MDRYWLAGLESSKKSPHIVLIHDLSVPALAWAPLVSQLVEAGHRVLPYDLYGGGSSDAPAPATYDALLYVTQLALLLQHVGWPHTRLRGVSMGGAIVAAFVAMLPDLVENEVVLVASAGLVEGLTANPLIYAYLRRLASKPDHRQAIERALVHELALESRSWEGRRVLVVHGTADHTVPPAHSSHLKALLANSTCDASRGELALVPGAGHALPWTHADAVGAGVCASLAGG
ncbi:Alpha/Beta hydrolase protein [Mycena vulgaris]|nr:Alpha/Beta hydrolase protein [Mycena vulgaris]